MSASPLLQYELLNAAGHPLWSRMEDKELSAAGAWPLLADGLGVLLPPDPRDLCSLLLTA